MADKKIASAQKVRSEFAKAFDRMPVHRKTISSLKDLSADLMEMGFVIHDNHELSRWERKAPVFRVTPPEGWSLRYSLGSVILAIFDDKDRERGAFSLEEDETGKLHGSLNLLTRYWIGSVALDARNNPTDDHQNEAAYAAAVTDASLNYKPVFVLDVVLKKPTITRKFLASEGYIEFLQALSNLKEAAVPWLDSHYPHWRSPAHYWD